MAFGVFIHRSDSHYDEVPSEQYQFPKQYLTAANQCAGDWIIYLEPSGVRGNRGYFAVAKIQKIVEDPDPNSPGMYLAVIEPRTYLDFGNPVPFRLKDGSVAEQGLLNDQGKLSGRVQYSIRLLSPSDFARIVERGLGNGQRTQPYVDQPSPFTGFADDLEDHSIRDRFEQMIITRPVRDHNFRQAVLRAYGDRCAISGLQLINGGGSAEAEAAHIKPVAHNGPDIVGNGIALSRTAHWMFDRGLVGLDKDFKILISRQSNNPEDIESIINDDRLLRLPLREADYPRKEFLEWHREHCFKH